MVGGGELSSRLVHDAPHNLLWAQRGGRVVHHKGATPAAAADPTGTSGGCAARWGEPVILPGSMGASSFVLRGLGNPRTLASACHGAGRRGALSGSSDVDLDAFLQEFCVVTPLDPRDPGVARRVDVLARLAA